MANTLYDQGREGFLMGDISWRDHDIRAILIDLADYAINLATHKFLSDVPAVARVSVSPSFVAKTGVAGVADADNITFPLVTGDPSEAIVVYRHTGADATARLIGVVDTVTVSGAAAALFVSPNGGDIVVAWDDTGNRIFKL